jgi:CheY-like chemotaxis protein
VITASNGEEAVKVASLMRPNIILMDISMPLLDGLGATAKIREDENLRTVPVIATTSYSTAGFRRAAYDVGFNGYLTKPLDFEQLHDLIARLLLSK